MLRVASASLPEGVTMEIVDCRLPLYDQDEEAKGVPADVAAFKSKVRIARQRYASVLS